MVSVHIAKICSASCVHELFGPQHFVMLTPKASISENSERLPVEVKRHVDSIPYRTVPV
jgi:hypothetical protein